MHIKYILKAYKINSIVNNLTNAYKINFIVNNFICF